MHSYDSREDKGSRVRHLKETGDMLERSVHLLLFYLGYFKNHVLRVTIKAQASAKNSITDLLEKIGKDKRYSSVFGWKKYKTKSRIIRLVMVSNGFKGYSDEMDCKEWQMECPNCQMTHRDLCMKKL